MSFPRPCMRCGRRIEHGSYCPGCQPAAQPPRPESERRSSQPWREHYDADYAHARLARYELCHGRCEAAGCGVALLGALFPLGSPWEAHHHLALSDGGDNSVSNLRCLCLPCHRRITKDIRRMRKEARQL